MLLVTCTAITAIERSQVFSGDVVWCQNLRNQRDPDLQRRALAMNNSFGEIMVPPWDDDQRRVRLRCMVSNPTVCAAVKPRYLRSVPKIFVHYIEDYDESMR